MYFQGDKGDKGNTGEKGMKGHTGHKGDQVRQISFYQSNIHNDENLLDAEQYIMFFHVLSRGLWDQWDQKEAW